MNSRAAPLVYSATRASLFLVFADWRGRGRNAAGANTNSRAVPLVYAAARAFALFGLRRRGRRAPPPGTTERTHLVRAAPGGGARLR